MKRKRKYRDWNTHCTEMRMLMMANPSGREIDLLAAMFGELGGIQAAARKIGVSRLTLYGWLERGLGTVSLHHIDLLCRATGISADTWRVRRMGPFVEKGR